MPEVAEAMSDITGVSGGACVLSETGIPPLLTDAGISVPVGIVSTPEPMLVGKRLNENPRLSEGTMAVGIRVSKRFEVREASVVVRTRLSEAPGKPVGSIVPLWLSSEDSSTVEEMDVASSSAVLVASG
jgi:hypothetical protein